MKECLIALVSETNNEQKKSYIQRLAQQLALPIDNEFTQKYTHLLVVTAQRLELRCPSAKTNAIYVDFLGPTADYRRLKGGGKNQLIARAIGIKPNYKPKVIDATAGLGADSFVLACLGCQLRCLERSPIIAALLEDGLTRLHHTENALKFAMELLTVDAITYLQALKTENYPDVIYLDPMFPPRNKSALVKKEMRVLRDLVGEDEDASILLEMALQRTKKRVVVKRPRLAAAIHCTKAPDILFNGQSSRFDVYVIPGVKNVSHS